VHREGRKYAGSTSSTSGLLGQLYYLISGDKRVDTSNLSSKFKYQVRIFKVSANTSHQFSQPQTFTPGQRIPASVILHYRDGVYLIDSAGDAVPGLSGKNILTWMVRIHIFPYVPFTLTNMQGTLLEKHLTHSPEDFLRLTRFSNVAMAKEPKREAYRYAKASFCVILVPSFCVIYLYSQTSSSCARNSTVLIPVSPALACLISRPAL